MLITLIINTFCFTNMYVYIICTHVLIYVYLYVYITYDSLFINNYKSLNINIIIYIIYYFNILSSYKTKFYKTNQNSIAHIYVSIIVLVCMHYVHMRSLKNAIQV